MNIKLVKKMEERIAAMNAKIEDLNSKLGASQNDDSSFIKKEILDMTLRTQRLIDVHETL